MKREATPSPKAPKRKDNSLSPYLKSQKKKEAMEANYSKGLSVGSNNAKQYLLMPFPEISKVHPEISQLKGYRIGPVRPATEGKKPVATKPDGRTEGTSNSEITSNGKKPSSASRRPASPNVVKPNCNSIRIS